MANMGYDEHLPAQTPADAMSERAHSPWQGDYDIPSVGPVSTRKLFKQVEKFCYYSNIFVFYNLCFNFVAFCIA